MNREIDTRVIDPAGKVLVTLFSYETPFGETFGIQVDKAGSQVHLFSTQDKSEAVELFRHPFVRPECPDVWARDYEQDSDEDYAGPFDSEDFYSISGR